MAAAPSNIPKEPRKDLPDRLRSYSRYTPQRKYCRSQANYSQKEVKRDDILDALAAAITAKIGFDNLSCLPPQPERDPQGLAMEMVYFLGSFYKSVKA